MNDKLNGRKVYTPRGRDPAEDLNLLADAIAESGLGLFNDQDESVILIAGGARVEVGPDDLRKIIATVICTKHVREVAGEWEVELRPHEPDEMTLRNLLTAKRREDGGLIWRLPRTPRVLSSYQQNDIRQRLQRGERAEVIGRSIGVDAATLRELAR